MGFQDQRSSSLRRRSTPFPAFQPSAWCSFYLSTWFIGMARALGNLIGNCVATVVIAAWEKDLDRTRAKEVLGGTVTVDVTTG